MPVTPWPAVDATRVLSANPLQPVWSVHMGTLAASPAPAFDIEVTLDGGRTPWGSASFKLPASWMAETGAGSPFRLYTPYLLPQVVIQAGYVQDNGIPNTQPLFVGFITKRTWSRNAKGDSFVQFEAQTAECAFDFTSNRAYTPSGTYTRVKQSVDAIASSTPFYRTPWISEESSFMNSPGSVQLAEYRAQEITVGDNVMDWVRSCATALGQWVRGDQRYTASATPILTISADPYPYRASFNIPVSAFGDLDRVEDLDGWANIVNLTAEWLVGDDTKSKRKPYLGAGVTSGSGAVRAKDVKVYVKPSGGTMPASWGLANAWIQRVGPMCEVRYTGTTRAHWWLQPRIDAISLTGNGLGDTAGPIDSIKFQVDQGLMAVTWTADNPYTGV